jgi:4-hydroxybenzoate polyprenyltransferase
MLWYGLDGAIYFVYLVRSLRLIYAHTTDVTRQNTIIFKLFKHEYLLGLICAALLLLRIIPVYFNPDPQNYSFKTMI